MPYESTRLTPDSCGKLVEMIQFAIHCAAADTASAMARMRLLNISPSSTHTTGPQLIAKETTYRLAATSAMLPHGDGSVTSLPLPVAVEKHTVSVIKVTIMPAAPPSSSGLRPTLSIMAMAANVETMFVTLVMTLVSNALLSENPTARHSV